MALTESVVSHSSRCRICLQNELAGMRSLYDSCVFEDVHILLSEIITLCSSIQVNNNDLLPQYICKNCTENAKTSYYFRTQCEKSDKILKKELATLVKQEEANNECVPETCPHEKAIDTQTPRDVAKQKSFKCVTCELEFPTRKKLNAHSETHAEHKCAQCGSVFPDALALRKHTRNHKYDGKHHLLVPPEQRSCNQCGKQFQYRSSMLKHRRKHDAPPKSCVFCNAIPTTPAQLAQHMEREHAHLKTIRCKVCDKMFFKEDNLRLHLITHSGVKRHICEICGASFALAGNLAAHRRLHTGEKPYTCSHCGRGFTQQAALRSHEAGHSNKRDHVCTDCGAAFSRAGALRNHMKRHLPNRPFACSMCTKTFTFSSERKRHMTIHSGIKNHVCEVCGRRFNRNTNLKVHMRIHTGETPHVCRLCGKGFIQAHCLRNHMNTHKQDESVQNGV